MLVQKSVIASAQTLLRLIGPDVLHCAPLRHPMLARNSPKSLQQGAYAVFEDMLQAWLLDGYSLIFRSYVFGPLGLKGSGSATLHCKI